MGKSKTKKITAGDLIRVLSEVKSTTPVVLNACCKGDVMRTTWCKDFTCAIRAGVLTIYGTF